MKNSKVDQIVPSLLSNDSKRYEECKYDIGDIHRHPDELPELEFHIERRLRAVAMFEAY